MPVDASIRDSSTTASRTRTRDLKIRNPALHPSKLVARQGFRAVMVRVLNFHIRWVAQGRLDANQSPLGSVVRNNEVVSTRRGRKFDTLTEAGKQTHATPFGDVRRWCRRLVAGDLYVMRPGDGTSSPA